ncbi:hypothetical protein HPB50_000707 [Hyalomma asiaticum]|uniref:Uncharacterized protein n=1 Tax=Hyalomma asiaticum TaxID=266040 RepID=A0ACB7SLD8_HYAAI|nr:hypothetical protein HPB50_000707 [Hyalomma asiaticum]
MRRRRSGAMPDYDARRPLASLFFDVHGYASTQRADASCSDKIASKDNSTRTGADKTRIVDREVNIEEWADAPFNAGPRKHRHIRTPGPLSRRPISPVTQAQVVGGQPSRVSGRKLIDSATTPLHITPAANQALPKRTSAAEARQAQRDPTARSRSSTAWIPRGSTKRRRRDAFPSLKHHRRAGNDQPLTQRLTALRLAHIPSVRKAPFRLASLLSNSL